VTLARKSFGVIKALFPRSKELPNHTASYRDIFYRSVLKNSTTTGATTDAEKL
jgi:hypothetical protein